MQCCNVDEILYGPHLAPQLLLVTLLTSTLFIYFLKKDVNKTIIFTFRYRASQGSTQCE